MGSIFSSYFKRKWLSSLKVVYNALPLPQWQKNIEPEETEDTACDLKRHTTTSSCNFKKHVVEHM